MENKKCIHPRFLVSPPKVQPKESLLNMDLFFVKSQVVKAYNLRDGQFIVLVSPQSGLKEHVVPLGEDYTRQVKDV